MDDTQPERDPKKRKLETLELINHVHTLGATLCKNQEDLHTMQSKILVHSTTDGERKYLEELIEEATTNYRRLGTELSSLKLKFRLPVEEEDTPIPSHVAPTIAESCIIPQKDHAHITTFMESVEKNEASKLLYRASRDGWTNKDFHGNCDDQGATLTVIQSSGGYIFGGYIDQSWHSKDDYIYSEQAFLYSLQCHADLPPTKFHIQKGDQEHAAFGDSDGGPTFGRLADIYIASNANVNTGSSTTGCSYDYPSGVDTSTFLTGSNTFQVSEIEVFHVS